LGCPCSGWVATSRPDIGCKRRKVPVFHRLLVVPIQLPNFHRTGFKLAAMTPVRVVAMAALVAVSLLFLGAAKLQAIPAWREVALFTISKTENKNQVQYALRVDDHCAPIGDAPVYAYWRMIELGPTRAAPLLARELPAYGVSSQAVLEKGDTGGKVRLTLQAVPSRPILVQTAVAAGGTCQAWSTLTINGVAAHLYNVHVRLRWPLGVEYLLLQGWAMDGKRTVTEMLKR
jgi:Domain of unknown function (DUF4833)